MGQPSAIGGRCTPGDTENAIRQFLCSLSLRIQMTPGLMVAADGFAALLSSPPALNQPVWVTVEWHFTLLFIHFR